MYSDAYVTDFDSDDDEIVWSRDDDDCDDDDSVSTVTRQSRPRVYEFGEFVENYGWVQCPSRSQQGRLYFHNMHSNCNTWYRPVSRYIDVPSVPLEKAHCTDNQTMDDLELMSISDDEKEQNPPVATCDNNGLLLMEMPPRILVQWYDDPRMSSTSDVESNFSDSNDGRNEDSSNNNGDDDDDSQLQHSLFSIENFLETEILVSEGEVNTECRQRIKDDDDNASTRSLSSVSTEPRQVVYGAPCLKKIGFEDQVVKWQDTCVPRDQGGPRKIICEMYGVKTISYDLPGPDEVRPEAGVKSTRLSDSDSDDGGLPPSLQPEVTMNTSFSLQSNWCDFTKGMYQPSLSDSSSSSSGSTSSSASTCSTCSTCYTSCE
ncbi:PREDICTED: uncharacterized protein LOC106750008 [Dinoponera quadriceps]|uniref:Uncharacterized protein LOC106750008 n=1 Tax=Dinoponera quadriceps TaxID=609295 RepID=A0A6P3Y5Z6_DINQU|nr:PREDICTED: uncharacterized protein LOC106750008 [Dinoponera quadriceps]